MSTTPRFVFAFFISISLASASPLRWLANTDPVQPAIDERCSKLFEVPTELLGKIRKDFKFDPTPTFEIAYKPPVKDQCQIGLCWDFATVSAIEAEIFRITGKKVTLSTWFVGVNSLKVRLIEAIGRPGTRLEQGGVVESAMWLIQNFGMMPDEAYVPRTKFYTKEYIDHFYGQMNDLLSEHYYAMGEVIQEYKTALAKLKPGTEELAAKLEKDADAKIQVLAEKNLSTLLGLVDVYAGKTPEKFVFEGVEYTPQSFAKEFLPVQEGTIIKVYPKRDPLPAVFDPERTHPGDRYWPFIRMENNKPKVYNYNLDKEVLDRPMDADNPNQIFMDPEEMLEKLAQQIESGQATPFAFEVKGRYMDDKTGIMSIDGFYNYIGHKETPKAYRWGFGLMEGGHMVMGVGGQRAKPVIKANNAAFVRDKKGKIVWIKFENSWSEKHGDKGFYYMHADYFKEYVMEIYLQGKVEIKTAPVLPGFLPGSKH